MAARRSRQTAQGRQANAETWPLKEPAMNTMQIICVILLIALIIFYLWYRKRQA
ncbi:MAG: hypothetical protein HY718_16165 [Planctomycetes bacterium]|nr:hypothetical protein [Planctomycetota bacterium]